jgi:hypothetical protein
MKKYHEAHFGGFTKSGRVKVIYNEAFPFGVSWAVAYFKLENVPEGVVIPKED